MKRLIVCSLVATTCIGLLLAPSGLARGGTTEPKPPTLTLNLANHYAKKGTAEIVANLRPIHTSYGSQHIEEVITYGFKGLDPCKRAGTSTRRYFDCTVHLTSTVYTGGEYPKEETTDVVKHEKIVVAPLSAHVPKQQSKTEARFHFQSGFRIVVFLR